MKARNLEALLQIINGVENRIAVRQIDEHAVRKDALQAGHEDVPFIFPMEIVDHQKAAAIEVIAQPLGVGFAQLPVSNLDRIEPGPLEHLVALDVDDLLDRSCIDPGEPPDPLHEMALRRVGVGAPTTSPSASETAAAETAIIPIAQPRKGELFLHPSVRRIFISRTLHLTLVILRAPLARALKAVEAAPYCQGQGRRQ